MLTIDAFMKNLLSILVLLCLVTMSAAQQSAQSTLSLDLNRASFQDLVGVVERQTPYRVFYDAALMDSLQITKRVQNSPIERVLADVLEPYGFYANFLSSGRIYVTPATVLSTSLVGVPFRDGLDSAGRVEAVGGAGLGHLSDFRGDTTETVIAVENRLFEFGTRGQSGSDRVLTGYVRDANTGNPLPMTSIQVQGTSQVVLTDQQGYYSLTIPQERSTVLFSSVGKKDTQRQLLMYGSGRLDVSLENRVYALDEVMVSGTAGTGVTRTQMGVERLALATIRQTPTVFGEADVVRIVLNLPGVQSVGEAASGFNVRGGSTDQNLVLFNDATIYNPSHFFGFFSAFNPDAVSSIELYKSSVPARFGGRLASVLDVSAKEGNRQQVAGSGGIGLLTGRMTLEGPLGPKTSFLVGGRSTYSDWLLSLIPDESFRNSRASFYDGNIQLTHDINDDNFLYLVGYFSNDYFGLSADTTYQYQNLSFNAKWKSIYNTRLNSVLTLGMDGYEFQMSNTYRAATAHDLDYRIRQVFAKLDLHHNLNERHQLLYGFSTIRYQIDPGAIRPVGEFSEMIEDVLPQEEALESALHVTDVWQVNDRFTLDLGLRYSMFNALGSASKTYHAPEWRVSGRYILSPKSSMKLGYNSLMQYIHMLSNTTAITPTDTWKLSDAHIRPQYGDQFSLGWYRNFDSDRIETSVELYYKRMEDYLDYKGGARLLMNRQIHEDVLGTEARAYGAEFLIKKQTGRLNGWLSYTYSKVEQRTVDVPVEQRINGGAYYPSNHDKPHNVTLVGNYKFSHRFSFSLNGTYSTGRPITLPVAQYEMGGITRVYYSDRNQYRIPDYFRIDAAFNIEGNHKVKKLAHSSWTLGVYNLTGRENPFSVYYQSEGTGIQGYQLSVFGSQIPFLTYNFKF